jgi:hypothetical protein
VGFRNGAGPEAAATVLGARKGVGIDNAALSKPPPDNSQVIRATLTGADTAVAAGIVAAGHVAFAAARSRAGARTNVGPHQRAGGMSVVAIHQTSKPHELARAINKLTDGIARDEKLAGQHLLTLKGTKPPGITWEHYLRDCGVKISARHADRLIEGFRGPTRKRPMKPKPDSDIVSEPPIENIEESPEAAEREFEETIAPPVILEKLRFARIKIASLQSEVEELKTENAELRRQLEVFKSPVRCEFVEDDGGRAAAGYEEALGGCVARAITIATGKPYVEVFEALQAAYARYVKRLRPGSEAALIEERRRTEPIHNGCPNKVYGPYLKSLGWQYTRLRERTYLRAGALPSGRLIVSVDQHLLALIDGVIHDTYDSGGAGRRPVDGYWSQAAS